jgi:hypothetical protein
MNKLQERSEKGKQNRNDMDVMREQSYKTLGYKSAKAYKDAQDIYKKKSTEELKKIRLDFINKKTFPDENQDMINEIEEILKRREKAEERKVKEKEKEKKIKASFKEAVQKKEEDYQKTMK